MVIAVIVLIAVIVVVVISTGSNTNGSNSSNAIISSSSYYYIGVYVPIYIYIVARKAVCIHDVHECIHTHIPGVCIAFILNVFWTMHALDVLLLPVSVSCFGPQQPTDPACSCP